MNGIADMKQRASTLRKQGDCGQAVELFRVLWEEHREQCNEWDGWGYAFSLRKLGRSEKALEVCRQALPLRPDMDHLTSLYGRCLYDVEIERTNAEIQQNESRFLDAAEEIFRLGEPGKFTAHFRTLMRVVDYYRQKPASPTARILEWCDRIQSDQLSDVPGPGPDGKGRTIGYASDREKWYACRSKALFEVGRFEECIAFSQEALDAFPCFHYDNDIWFKWRIALSKAELGDRETAISELEALLSRKQDWFIHHSIAKYLFELGRTDEALVHAIEAVLGTGSSDLGKKWELFLLMGRIFQARGEMEEAWMHVLLSARVRQEQDWKIPPELGQAINELGMNMNAEGSARDLEKELRQHWQSRKVADMPIGKGEIKTILDTGTAGFIRGDNEQDYYFKANWFQGPRHLLKPGLRVTFRIEKNPDPGKRDMAKYVKPL
jgi:tetratricopeptide (TPR) repeat protein